MTYYCLLDHQTGRIMSSGLNTTSIEQLIDHYISYKSVDTDVDENKFVSVEHSIARIEMDEFEILTSNTPFPDDEDF